ncbi:hypothetical protein [Lacticaseibacillus sp. GG6-2]
MSTTISILMVAGMLLAVIFVMIFAVGHKFKNDNKPSGRVMELVGMIGVFVCVIGVFLVAFSQVM